MNSLQPVYMRDKHSKGRDDHRQCEQIAPSQHQPEEKAGLMNF